MTIHGPRAGRIRSWTRWADEARTHSTDGLVNGRPLADFEADILARARAAAAEAEANALLSGVRITPNHDR